MSNEQGSFLSIELCLRYVLEEKVLEIEIEPGMKDGYQYPFVAEGKA